jgi:hypothetical protein
MIFSQTADLVRSGDKTQTRRPRKPFDEIRTANGQKYIYNTKQKRVRYRVGRTYSIQDGRGKFGRGRIRIIDLWIEKLLDIDTEGVIAEGIMGEINGPPPLAYYKGFIETWTRLYPKGSDYAVENNPEVIVIEFERCD